MPCVPAVFVQGDGRSSGLPKAEPFRDLPILAREHIKNHAINSGAQARDSLRCREIRCVLRLVRDGEAIEQETGGIGSTEGSGHLPLLCAGRPLHLAAEDSADQLLHLRLHLLRQPLVLERRARALHGRGGRRADARLLQAQLHRGPVPLLRHHPLARLHDGRAGARRARSLRETHKFGGYIHLKVIPNASPELLAEAGRWADRLSTNIELPTDVSLEAFAPEKKPSEIRTAMAHIQTLARRVAARRQGSRTASASRRSSRRPGNRRR